MSTQPVPSRPPRKSGAQRTREWRGRMRAKGLVLRAVWTYDIDDPAFLARLKADFAALGRSEGEDERHVMREIEAMYELDEPIPAWIEQPGDHEAG